MALIDRDTLGVVRCNPDSMLDPAYAAGWNGLLNVINNAPTIDAAPVVRCKECKHKHEHRTKRNNQLIYECYRQDGNEFGVHPDDYCSYGQRKEPD